MFTVGELFAGIGGIGLGFKQNGFQILWANEIDVNACLTYSTNFDHQLLNQDMKAINLSNLNKVDIIVGGFPCQSFSIAGKRNGFLDERGNIFFEMFRVIKYLQPKVVFLENVKNLVSHNNGETLKIVFQTLKANGYPFICHQIINTAEYSKLPQNRERLYLVAFQNQKQANKFQFPAKEQDFYFLSQILENKVDSSFYYHKKIPFYLQLQAAVTEKNYFYQWRRKYVRQNKQKLCPTLTANMGTGGHNVPIIKVADGIRKLTPRECFRLQGFPENFILPHNLAKSHLYKQIGNSVSIPIIHQISKKIKETLSLE